MKEETSKFYFKSSSAEVRNFAIFVAGSDSTMGEDEFNSRTDYLPQEKIDGYSNRLEWVTVSLAYTTNKTKVYKLNDEIFNDRKNLISLIGLYLKKYCKNDLNSPIHITYGN